MPAPKTRLSTVITAIATLVLATTIGVYGGFILCQYLSHCGKGGDEVADSAQVAKTARHRADASQEAATVAQDAATAAQGTADINEKRAKSASDKAQKSQEKLNK